MRKFTFILSLLVAFVATAMAQVEVGKVYTMTLKNDATSAVTESSEYLSVSTLAEGEKSQQWLIEAGENGVMVRNMSTGRYMNPMGMSTQWTTVQYNPATLYAVQVGSYYTLGTAENTDNYEAMHKAGHGAIVGWSTGSDNTQWNFTEVAVDAAELETLVAEWNAPIEKAKAADELAALIEQISNSIGKIALTTSMISSNTSTGWGDGTFADMLDGNPNTHYGTSWWGAFNANHYVQIDLGEQPADITEFTYTWVNRNTANNTPWAGYISASTDNETFDTLVSFDKDADGTGDVQSVNITGGGSNAFGPLSAKNAAGEAYRYIRLTCTSSNFSQTDLDYTMALAELALTIPVTEAEEAYLEHCATAQAVLDNEESTIEELQAAKETLYNAVICDITYNYKYNGNLISTSTVSINNGSAYPALQVPYGYTVASGAPEGNATASGSFDIELEVALPFEYAASYSEVEHWYFMTIHSDNKFYLADNDTIAYIALDKKSIPANELDKYTWGFVGDPITGFQVVNKAAGETKILSSSTTTTDGNTGGNTFPILTEVPVADGNNTYWIPSQGSVDNGFFLAQKDYANNKMNARSGKLAYWNSGADKGSTFLVAERDMDAELPTVAFAPTGEENVSSIDTITVTCANGIALSNNSELAALLNAYIWDAATGSATQISKELTATVVDDTTIILTVDSAITTEGNWYLNIPAGYFVMNVNGVAIESVDLSGSYNVVDNSPLTITEMSAADNSVINDFAIDVTMVFSHDVSEYPSGHAYILNADNDTISEVAISAQDADGNWFPEYNKLRIYSKEEIKKSGVYTLVLPEGYITRTSDGAGLAATTLTYTLSIPVTISAPILDNKGGVYTDEFLRVAFSVNTTGVSYPSVKYYYTTDGTTPTKESDYSGAAMLYEGCTLKVMAVMKVDTVEYVSEVTTAEYIFSEMKPFKVATSNAELADGKIFISANDSLVAKSLPADYSYGYLYTATKAAANGYIENAVYYGFTLTAVDTCYTIQDQYGRYLYQTGKYDSFNVSDTLPESGALWTISIAENGEATITNVAVNKYIQYSTQYESFGSYASAKDNAVMPKIYVPCEYPTLSYYPCEYPEVESLTTITFTCESGIALNDELSAILTDYMNEYELVANVIDDNTIELTVSEELPAGAWNMIVPEGLFILDPNGMALANSEIYDCYTIIDNTPLAIDECTPAEGEVTSLKYIIVAFTKDINPYGDAVLKDAEGETVATASYGFMHPETYEELPWNYVVYTLPEEITEAGTYTLVIPEGAIYCNNELAPEFTITFTIAGATGIEGVGAEDGEQEIYDITGRKVEAITAPGIYIVNGKKVVIK